MTGKLDLSVRHQVEDNDHAAARVSHDRLRGMEDGDSRTPDHIKQSEVVLERLLSLIWLVRAVL